MSNTAIRMPLQIATAAAQLVVSEIEGACEQIVIAGSIRRQREDVGDIEIVCVPKIETVRHAGMFEDVVQDIDLLDALIQQMMAYGRFVPRLDKNGRQAIGSRYRRLYVVQDGVPVPLDLFSAARDSFGLILAIRTGPAAYSHQFVTPTSQYTTDGRRGLLPAHLQVKDGALRHRGDGEVIPTPTEASFFEAIGIPYVDPSARSTIGGAG